MIKHPYTEDRRFAELEFYRMGFDKESKWRISDINKDFELCNTYPRFLIVPSSFKDEDLESVAKFRYFRRIPTAVWRHNKNGCFIVRSSQPTVGWFGWFRSDLDEALVQSYVSNTTRQQTPNEPDTTSQSTNIVDDDGQTPNKSNTTLDNSAQPLSIDSSDDSITTSLHDTTTNNSATATTPTQATTSKMLIIDARSYAAAMANRAKGGGCECSEYYQQCEVHFMNLANIHSIRRSYHAIRSVCEAYSEQSNK
jgi:myotubularin-related protein 3/4